MTPERFQRIRELYQAALDASEGGRAALLAKADPHLRREVESLLAQRGSGAFLDRPAVQNAGSFLEDPTATDLASGACLGPYRIDSKLGAGGMGEVFRAIDVRLGRAVAVKTAHERFTDRFEREARAISALNHPHICTLYDIGPNYLVMELVEGETIAARLKRGPLPIKEALLYASQIAAALVEAHSKGIIHRDLKPGNVMIARTGVKVLDFGLAKSDADETVTASRMVMGTPAYMAPEQREAKQADARTDIYSFGCVFYEMLTGTRPGAVRKRLPSRKLEAIVDQCLQEEPALRWQSAAELERALISAAPGQGTALWQIAVPSVSTILAVAAAAYFFVHRAPALTEKDTIVLADFENRTGDAVFDDTLRQGLSVELQQSPFLETISDQRVQQTLVQMGQRKDARLTPEIAQQICERTDSAAILEGSISSLGSQYVVGLRAKACTTGRILDQEQAQAARREDVLNALSQIARKFRTKVGESLATVEKHSTQHWEATTASLEAWKAYSTAMKVNMTEGNAAAIPLMKRTVEIDPTFAMAYAALGLNYSAVGEWALSREATTQAWKFRDHASDPEKFFIDFTYDRQVTGNLEKAFRTLELWAQTYPRNQDPDPRMLMAGLSAKGTGRWETVTETAVRDIATRPGVVFGYENLKDSYFFQDRFDEAEKILQQAYTRKLETSEDVTFLYIIAFLKGDQEEMERVASRGAGKGGEHQLASVQALISARFGKVEQASQSSARAVSLALQQGAKEPAARYKAVQAVWQALFGETAAAQSGAAAVLANSNDRDVQYAAGLALGFAGDAARAESVAAGLEKSLSEDTFVRFTYAPVLHALAALAHGRPADSLKALEITVPYESAVNSLNLSLYLGGLHSAYVRGEAFIATHQYAEASKEFQKILDHRGSVGADPLGALAHLQLGRALNLAGDKAKAKAEYEDFLNLWKDADGGVPVLKQAKEEYAKLQ